ncbi:KdsC family phosphatase [Leptospira jelokensis]|uniref:KdsC family phosphatase n=1 Tax=Leptospira jelokensis TaxID=2484931 RepID=UPI001090F38F|nr:HAD family hydrolase [Leptospira jelokensis]TGL99195.1 3-deoxy-D-manno-octulosonate 8-phosphate phosphatase [Leptospira jelokensis]
MNSIESLFKQVELIAFDFDGVFTDNFVIVNEKGEEAVRCSRSDGLGLSRLKSLGVHLVIISTEKNPVVSKRAEKLGLDCYQNIDDKGIEIRRVASLLKVKLENTMFVGNDINDIPALSSVGIPVGVNDSYPEIYPHIKYRTQKNGGKGAVREICDLVYFAKGK